MGQRIDKSFRLHPVLEQVVKHQAEGLGCTETFIVEQALVQMFKDQLPVGFEPGMRMRRSDSK